MHVQQILSSLCSSGYVNHSLYYSGVLAELRLLLGVNRTTPFRLLPREQNQHLDQKQFSLLYNGFLDVFSGIVEIFSSHSHVFNCVFYVFRLNFSAINALLTMFLCALFAAIAPFVSTSRLNLPPAFNVC